MRRWEEERMEREGGEEEREGRKRRGLEEENREGLGRGDGRV